MRWGYCTLVSLLLLGGCQPRQDQYAIAGGPPGTLYNRTAGIIARVWEQQGLIAIDNRNDPKADPVTNCTALATRRVDFALVADDAPLDLCIDPEDPERTMRLRAIAPLYPEVLFVIRHPSHNAETLKDLVSNRRVGLGPLGSQSARFARRVLNELASGSRAYEPVFGSLDSLRLSEELPVIAVLAPVNDPQVSELLRQGGQVFSLDDPARYGHGSLMEGYAARYIHTRPYLLPAGVLRSQPTAPVLTLAVDILLVTRDDLDEETVHDLTEALFDHQQELINQNPLFYTLSEEFDRRTLQFPLHPGTIRYLERNNPTFLERYAEVIALIVTFVVMLYGGITAVTRWLRQRRKERIDAYYIRVLDIERRGREATKLTELDHLIEELLRLKEEAIQRLVDEKLSADDSFRIFESLAANNLTTLRYRRERLVITE